MSDSLRTVSPVDGRVYVERPLASPSEIEALLAQASRAAGAWRSLGVADRVALLRAAVASLVDQAPRLAEELTWQMGRPVSQSPGELRGFQERAVRMLDTAEQALADLHPPGKPGFERWIRREPHGVVVVVAPWNYPYLTSVNAVIPALASGNVVVLKHSHQTPLCAERYAQAFQAAGLPPGVFQYVHAGHQEVERLVADPRVGFVCFTGSVEGGFAIQRALSGGFTGSGLELGGNDPAYVRPDADLSDAAANLVDGSYFNSGQSCCGIERIYVHRSIHDRFVETFVDLAGRYRVGDPTLAETTLGPMARAGAARQVRAQIAEAVAAGARPLLDPARFGVDPEHPYYLAPQVLTRVDHSMRIMKSETFGPVVGIMAVDSDDEAVRLMNDSPYGLTASIWTRAESAARALADRIETGTVFMNRCDYLDPDLAWTGVKHSGRGCTLSRVGYEHLTRPKSFHFRMAR
ncbi:MAG: aldehyde dehydrogenase family protein [Burkholderiaceae bacterium]